MYEQPPGPGPAAGGARGAAARGLDPAGRADQHARRGGKAAGLLRGVARGGRARGRVGVRRVAAPHALGAAQDVDGHRGER